MTKILFIRYKKSKNILEGGEQGSQKNLNVLTEIVGADNITVFHIHDENTKNSIANYVKGAFYMLQNYFFGLTPQRVKHIVHIAIQYDVVFIDRSVFGIIAKKLKENHYQGKVIVFFHNVEVQYFEAKLSAKLPGKCFLIHCADTNDKFSCDYADKIIALNKRDEAELINRYGRKADVLIPVAFKDKYDLPAYSIKMTAKRPLCLFLGAYFPPNNEGIIWFLKNVLPFVNVQIKVVGKGMSKLKRDEPLLKEIEVYSDVPDLLPFFEEADIMVFPIFKGGGMKVKTCESLMYGKNIIAASEAFEGYELDYDKVGGKCDAKEDFIRVLQDFIQHPRPRFNAYARQMFIEKYSEDVVVDKFKTILYS